jgi:hypothetical protein
MAGQPDKTMNKTKQERVRTQLQATYEDVVKAITSGDTSEQRPLRQLEFIEFELKKMIAALEIGELPPRDQRVPGLWHIVIDTWSPDDALGKKVISSEIAYERL